MLGRAYRAAGRGGSVPLPPPPPPVGEAGRPAARAENRVLTTALPATFIGMLLVQALRPAEADAAPERPDGQQVPQPESGRAAPEVSVAVAPPVLIGADHTAETGHALIAPGSILLTGSLIDAGALTQLSGTSRFAELALHAPAPAAGSAFQLVSTDSHTADVTPAAVSLTPPTPLELPSFQLASTTGSGSGNVDAIGSNQHGGGGDNGPGGKHPPHPHPPRRTHLPPPRGGPPT